jgi:CBS domain-containing protein
LLGVVSEADLLVTVEREERADGRRRWRPRHTRRSGPVAKVGAQTARELMTAPVVTVAPNTTLAKAARTVDGVLLETMLIDPAEVAVTVADGVVTTTGAPDTRMDAEPAVRFVQGIEGVVDVIDELSRRVDDRVAAPWAERLP